MIETLVQILRTTTGEIAFAWASPGIQRLQEEQQATGGVDTPPDPVTAAQCGESGLGVDVEAEEPGFTSREMLRYRQQLFAETALRPWRRDWGLPPIR